MASTTDNNTSASAGPPTIERRAINFSHGGAGGISSSTWNNATEFDADFMASTESFIMLALPCVRYDTRRGPLDALAVSSKVDWFLRAELVRTISRSEAQAFEFNAFHTTTLAILYGRCLRSRLSCSLCDFRRLM